MKPAWLTSRYLPASCPSCLVAFRERVPAEFHPTDDSRPMAQAVHDSHQRFPAEAAAGGFVRFAACGNTTFRLLLEQRVHGSREEAESACDEHGFTSITEVETSVEDLDELNAFQVEQASYRRRIIYGDDA